MEFAKKIGYVNESHSISKNKELLVIDDYKNNIDISSIVEKHQISRTSLFRILAKNNIDRNRDKKRYTLDENVFDEINTDEKAYIIGFIAADGCIKTRLNALTITISQKDEEILHYFKKIIGTNKPIKNFVTHKDGKDYEYSQLVITNKHIIESLNLLGLSDRKTWSNTIAHIPEKHIRGFIRGYFDGDGSIFYSKKEKFPLVKISGFESNMLKIINYLKGFNILSKFYPDKRYYNTNKKTGEFGTLEVTHIIQKYSFLKWIYENDNGVHLKRKYLTAKKFIDEIENSDRASDVQATIYYKYAVLPLFNVSFCD